MYTPKKCGIKFDPPTLVVFYEDTSSGKLHRRSIPIRKFDEQTDISETVNKLKSSTHHLKYLEHIPHEQIESLLKMIQDKKRGIDPTPPSAYQPTIELNTDEDLNKLDDKDLNVRKAAMDVNFEKHRLNPGDEGFEYDKEIDFPDTGKIESGWDNEEEDYSDPEF
ncbi:hypothetical protein QZH41_013837 [Actinostola sp. cb2023]|nr:hypothetical protein QZH41_013837 [Actinostola sp. cb2023]